MTDSKTISNATPRSDEEVERFAGPAMNRTRRFARNFALAILAPVFLGCVIFMLARGSRPGENTRALAGGLGAGFVFMGLVPALVVRRLVGADATRLQRLSRTGIAYPGELTGTSGTTAQTRFSIRWSESGKDATASVNVPGKVSTPEGDITVLSSPDLPAWVAVVVGSAGLHVGRRKQ